MDVLFGNRLCREYEDRIVSVASCSSEKKTRYELKNTSKCKITKIDIDCLFSNSVKEKCDYAFIVYGKECITINFIELKDSKLTKAASQIISTVHMCNLRVNNQIVNARIVLTQTHRPDIISSQMRKLKDIIRKHGGNVEYKSKILSETI